MGDVRRGRRCDTLEGKDVVVAARLTPAAYQVQASGRYLGATCSRFARMRDAHGS